MGPVATQVVCSWSLNKDGGLFTSRTRRFAGVTRRGVRNHSENVSIGHGEGSCFGWMVQDPWRDALFTPVPQTQAHHQPQGVFCASPWQPVAARDGVLFSENDADGVWPRR